MANSKRFNLELLDLTELDRLAGEKVSTHMRILAVLLNGAVEDNDLGTPPGSPAEGDAYIVPSGATGDWSGWDPDIAIYVNGAWVQVPAVKGMLFWVDDTGAWRKFVTSWTAAAM